MVHTSTSACLYRSTFLAQSGLGNCRGFDLHAQNVVHDHFARPLENPLSFAEMKGDKIPYWVLSFTFAEHTHLL